jgi:hypothetical protein
MNRITQNIEYNDVVVSAMLFVVVPVPPEKVRYPVDAVYVGCGDVNDGILLAFPLLSLHALTEFPVKVRVDASAPSNHKTHGFGMSVG